MMIGDFTNHADLDPTTNVVRERWSALLIEIIGFLRDLDHYYMITLKSLDDTTRDDLL